MTDIEDISNDPFYKELRSKAKNFDPREKLFEHSFVNVIYRDKMEDEMIKAWNRRVKE